MITYNGWDREYLENKQEYYKLFDMTMMKEYEGNTEKLEKQIVEYTGRKHAVACANATDALQFSLESHPSIEPGYEVMCSNFSWISTASMINVVGCTPVFCDIDLDTYHISLDSVKAMYNENVKALIYTPLFGNMTDTTELEQFCKEKDIVIIEDAAQALGVSLNGKKAGTLGNSSSFSFNANKVIAGISGGGMWLCDDDDQADYVKKVRRHGKDKDFEILGRNSKMLVPNADVISFRLEKMEQWQKRRQEIAKIYDEILGDVVVIQKVPEGLDHNYHKYVVRFEDKQTRKRVKDSIKETGLFNPSVHYEKPLSENTMYSSNKLKHRKGNGNNAQIAADTIMSLPIHAWLTDDEVEDIANMVAMLV